MNLFIMRGLQERARAEASFASSGLSGLEAEHSELQRREQELELRLELARNAGHRAEAFKPRGEATYLCPCCAVYCDVAVSLTEVVAQTGCRHFVCANCANEFEFDLASGR